MERWLFGRWRMADKRMGIGRPLPTCMCILKNLAELGNFIGNNFIDLVKFLETKTKSSNFPCHKETSTLLLSRLSFQYFLAKMKLNLQIGRSLDEKSLLRVVVIRWTVKRRFPVSRKGRAVSKNTALRNFAKEYFHRSPDLFVPRRRRINSKGRHRYVYIYIWTRGKSFESGNTR